MTGTVIEDGTPTRWVGDSYGSKPRSQPGERESSGREVRAIEMVYRLHHH